MLRVGYGISGTNILSVGRGVSVGGGGGWRGPYDAIPSIAAAYGMRRLLSSYTGPILRLRRDNEEQDIGYTASGDLDVAAVAAFLDGTNGYITTWYDQSGNANHATQATAAAQPLYVAAGQNGRPVLRGDGTNHRMVHTYSVGQMEKSIMAVVSVNAGQTGFRGIYSTHGNGNANETMLLARLGTSGNWGTYSGTEQPASSSIQGTGWHIAVLVESAAGSGNYHLDGAADGTFAAARGQTGHIFGTPDSAQFMSGDIAEIVVANAAWSTEQRQAAEQAANDYWQVY